MRPLRQGVGLFLNSAFGLRRPLWLPKLMVLVVTEGAQTLKASSIPLDHHIAM